MNTPELSDSDTIQRYPSPSFEQILTENQMKELALTKATNLIELLNLQLEVQRNSGRENMRLLETEMRRKYETQIRLLRERVELLEQQLRQRAKQSDSLQMGKNHFDATVKKGSFVRASSLSSFENKKKQSVTKKYTQNSCKQPATKSHQTATIMVCDKLFKSQMVQLEECKQNLYSGLDRMVKQEYEELGHLINAIQRHGEDLEELGGVRKERGRNLVAEMGSVVKDQQRLINAWRDYSQELQDLHKSYFFKMQSVVSQTARVDGNLQVPLQDITQSIKQDITQSIKQSICQWNRRWRSNVLGLQHENDELKHILDGMIKLVKEGKKARV